MKKLKILFFPLEAGLAHITRSLAIAEDLKTRNHSVHFALPKDKIRLFSHSKVVFVPCKSHGNTSSIDFIKNVRNYDYMLNLAKDDLRIINYLKPDALVVDVRISAMAAALTTNIPTFFVTGSAGLPYDIYIPNFFRLPTILHSASQVPLLKLIHIAREKMFINTILKLMYGLNEKKESVEKLLCTVRFIVPEEKFYLPILLRRNNVSYVGHINWSGFSEIGKKDMPLKKNGKKTIYLTFGGTGFDSLKLVSLARELLLRGFRVIVSTSSIADPSDFPDNPSLFVSRYVSGKLANKLADIIVCHGGYGTMMDAVLAGKPVVSVPFNPDQWLHSIRFEELGMGICTTQANFRFLTNSLLLKWNKVQKLGEEVKTSKILKSIDTIISNYDIYRVNINKFRAKVSTNNPIREASEIIVNNSHY